MNPVVGLLLLVGMPFVLMAGAHLYAITAQDKKVRYVVVLDPRVRSTQRVVEDHIKRYQISVDWTWDASVKGYSALVPVKQVAALEQDRRVQSIQRREAEDFLDSSPAQRGAAAG